MIIPHSFIIFMLLLITTQSYQLSAAERLEVEIRSTILNIRETKSTISSVVGMLNQGDRLTETTILLEWFPAAESAAIQKIELDKGLCEIALRLLQINGDSLKASTRGVFRHKRSIPPFQISAGGSSTISPVISSIG
jgi:hypothetical protein